VNNASFGAYAEIVQSPQYRDNKERTMLSMLPDLLSDRSGGHLQVRVGTATVPDVQAALVSNNPYGDAGRLLEMGRRFRLDQGVLGVVAGRLDNAAEAVGLLAAARSQSITTLTSDQEVVLDSDAATLPVGIDGEAVTLDTPVRCTVRPLGLRVRLPKNRPGVPRPRGNIDWKQLWRLAFGRPERSTAPSTSGPD
jgi:diacylglycerol kinase family enzyme